MAAEYRRLVPAAVRATDGAGQMGLARLALGRGDGRAALAGFRGRLVDLWKNADPDLQPIVRDVKQRLARLVTEQQR